MGAEDGSDSELGVEITDRFSDDELAEMFAAFEADDWAAVDAIIGEVDGLTDLGAEGTVEVSRPSAEVLAEAEKAELAGESKAKGGADKNRGGAGKLRKYWVRGEGAAKIAWGTPGDFTRCVKLVSEHMPAERAKGYCALRHKDATGKWPGAGKKKKALDFDAVMAAAEQHDQDPDPDETKDDAMTLEHKADGLVDWRITDEDKGIVEALVSVTGILDRVGDIIKPGAYTKTLAERKPKGVYHHQWTEPVSKTLDARELLPGDPDLPASMASGKPWPAEAGALKVVMQFNLETQRGKEAFSDAKFFGPDQEWSIGYNVPRGGATVKSGVRHIDRLDLFEYSPVLFGAMPEARTASLKAAQEQWAEVKETVRGVDEGKARRFGAAANRGGGWGRDGDGDGKLREALERRREGSRSTSSGTALGGGSSSGGNISGEEADAAEDAAAADARAMDEADRESTRTRTRREREADADATRTRRRPKEQAADDGDGLGDGGAAPVSAAGPRTDGRNDVSADVEAVKGRLQEMVQDGDFDAAGDDIIDRLETVVEELDMGEVDRFHYGNAYMKLRNIAKDLDDPNLQEEVEQMMDQVSSIADRAGKSTSAEETKKEPLKGVAVAPCIKCKSKKEPAAGGKCPDCGAKRTGATRGSKAEPATESKAYGLQGSIERLLSEVGDAVREKYRASVSESGPSDVWTDVRATYPGFAILVREQGGKSQTLRVEWSRDESGAVVLGEEQEAEIVEQLVLKSDAGEMFVELKSLDPTHPAPAPLEVEGGEGQATDPESRTAPATPGSEGEPGVVEKPEPGEGSGEKAYSLDPDEWEQDAADLAAMRAAVASP